ncbi:MAG TPA: CheR family methyltransferase [Acidimicrobiales bacterium]|nr:CheR family methyltransferase [Acidimicrobiales bacterium]
MTATLASSDFDYVSQLVRTSAAIVLEPGKDYLVQSRLAPLAREQGLPDIAALVAAARTERGTALRDRIVEAMTTNETSFFRDVHPFEALKSDIIPAVMARRQAERTLTIWSAASSTGQEAYSLSMLLLDEFPHLASWKVTILASDISEAALDRARSGRYSQLEVNRGLPAAKLARHFDRDGATWVAKPRLREPMRFASVNLIGSWPAMPPIDIVMLRNVLIYFSVDTKREILGRMKRVMRPDGYLMLGNAETTLNIDDEFVRVEPTRGSCYQQRAHVTNGRTRT